MILYGDKSKEFKRNNMQANVVLVVLNVLAVTVSLAQVYL